MSIEDNEPLTANDVVEQAQAVYGEDDYPRGPVGEESV